MKNKRDKQCTEGLETRFLEFRIRKELTQNELAKSIGYSVLNISGIECGRNNPSVEMLAKLSNVYPDFNIDYIVNGNFKEKIKSIPEERKIKIENVNDALDFFEKHFLELNDFYNHCSEDFKKEIGENLKDCIYNKNTFEQYFPVIMLFNAIKDYSRPIDIKGFPLRDK
jgi:transcriptional regulator with XRE-family HTH domain